jgi:Ca2+-binding RTX toxin-like protein
MSVRRVSGAAVVAVAVCVSWPAATLADHISITAAVTTRLKERTSPTSWTVEISFSVTCVGAAPGRANFSGNLYLVDLGTGSQTYLGGVAGGSGRSTYSLSAGARERHVAPKLRISCFEDGTLHGSETIETDGNVVIVPARFDNGEGGPGGGNGGSGGGTTGGDPTEPLHSGGCMNALQGTDQADVLAGTGVGEVIFGYGADDVIRGGGGHDCLLGGRGNDVLRGENGDDRLTGGSGRDRLVGGAGTNAYDAGSGNDAVDAVNGRRETVRCGPGTDSARVDRNDRTSGCERVTRIG